jgi:hypothetical protein
LITIYVEEDIELPFADETDTLEELEPEEVVEDVEETNELSADCFPVNFSNTNIILLCAVKTVTIKRAGTISETTKNTKLKVPLERAAPVRTNMNTQWRRNANDPSKVI